MSRKPRDPAWLPPLYEAADVEAVQAVFRGEADPAQQRRALDWIITAAAGAYELSFRSDAEGGERETAFAEGRRFVGMQVVKLAKMAPGLIAKIRRDNAGR